MNTRHEVARQSRAQSIGLGVEPMVPRHSGAALPQQQSAAPCTILYGSSESEMIGAIDGGRRGGATWMAALAVVEAMVRADD